MKKVCAFFIGPAGAPACKRPGCGATWTDHYGAPPRDVKKAPPRQAARRARP